jgi:hypothetical protein
MPCVSSARKTNTFQRALTARDAITDKAQQFFH